MISRCCQDEDGKRGTAGPEARDEFDAGAVRQSEVDDGELYGEFSSKVLTLRRRGSFVHGEARGAKATRQ